MSEELHIPDWRAAQDMTAAINSQARSARDLLLHFDRRGHLLGISDPSRPTPEDFSSFISHGAGRWVGKVDAGEIEVRLRATAWWVDRHGPEPSSDFGRWREGLEEHERLAVDNYWTSIDGEDDSVRTRIQRATSDFGRYASPGKPGQPSKASPYEESLAALISRVQERDLTLVQTSDSGPEDAVIADHREQQRIEGPRH